MLVRRNGRKLSRIEAWGMGASLLREQNALVLRESAQMMRNFFKPTTSNEQDDLEPDSLEREDLDMSSQNDLDGIREANRAMEYDSDTSNDEPMDCEGDEDERSEDEQPEEGELSWVEGGLAELPARISVRFWRAH